MNVKFKRREFFTLLGGAAAWPLAVRAQQGGIRRVGVLLGGTASGRSELTAFVQALQQLGRTDGRSLKIEYRSGLGNAADTRKHARSWSRSRPTSSWSPAPVPSRGCWRRRGRYRSYSPASLMRSEPVLSRACRGRAATPPASSSSSTA